MVGLAGCISDDEGENADSNDRTDPGNGASSEDDDDRTRWSTFRGDAARTGVRSASAGPGESMSVAWELESLDLLEPLHDVEFDPDSIHVTGNYTSWPVVSTEHVIWVQGYEWHDWEDDDTSGESIRIIAADPDDGSIVWTNEVPNVEEYPQTDSGVFGAEIDGDSVYVPFLGVDGLGMVAYDLTSGDELDRFEFGLSLQCGQPVVEDNTIFFQEFLVEESRGMLHAFDADSGTNEWSVESSRPTVNTTDLTVDDETVWYFNRGENPEFVARDVADGSERWREPIDLPDLQSTGEPGWLAPPTLTKGRAYAAGAFRIWQTHDLAPLVSFDRESGDEHWRYEPPGIEDGEEHPAIWTQDLSAEEVEEFVPFSSMTGYPLLTDGLVFGTGWGDLDQGATTYLFALDPVEGELEWAQEIGSNTLAPVVANDVLYLITSGGVEAVSTDGERLDDVELEHTLVEHSPALGHGKLFIPRLYGMAALE